MKGNIFISIFLLLWAISAQAVIVPDIYTANRPIANYSTQARQDAVQEALQR